MQPQKIDSIHNYLTPDRTLHSLMSSSNKKTQAHFNRSLTQQFNTSQQLDPNSSFQASSPRKQRQSYKKKPNIYGSESSDKFLLDNRQGISENYNKISNNGYRDKGINYQIITNSQVSGVSQKSNKFQQIPTPKSQFLLNKKKDQPSYQPEITSSSNRKFIIPNKTNPDIARLAIQDTINKLVLTRDALSEQILELKRLLDDVSISLQNMDIEFERIKQKILEYTSKALDSAFRVYKKSLPNWSIYQSIQQKGLNKIAEMNQAIQICQNQEKLKSYGGKQAMQNNTQQFQLIIKQVNQAKDQCLAHRPIISQEKIKKLEAILKQIGQF